MYSASNLKARLLFVLAITFVGNSRLAAGNDQNAGRKLDENPGFISIDCGSNEDYIDEDTKISYISDKGLIDTGIVKTVSSDSPANLQRFAKNLRSFPQGTRNCYTLRPEQGKNNNYLIRATFIYGNYDGENQIPVFDLHLGVNELRTVNLTNAGPYGFYYDVIHVPLTDYIDVCLINTGRGVPFISALELRHLENSIYQTQGRALTKIRGYDIGRNSSDISVRNLSSSNLTGEIATSFSNLRAMQSLDLSYNDLTGPLPEFLSELPNLNTLNVSGNNLTGSVPEALLQKFRDGKLALSVGENPDLCLSVPCKRKKKKEVVVPIVASSIAAVLVLLFIFSALIIYRRKRKGDMVTKSNIKSKNQQYSYSEVVSITNDFRTIIGGGGFGKVYLGKLKDETQVAVKLLSAASNQGYKEFRAEAQLLMIVHHKNLVSLVGYCDEGAKKALIYEYMAYGNLLQHLSVTNTNVLTWNERIRIAVDAAQGLEYLHNGCKPPIIHRDLKPSNILLNEHMQAKIADFGLSRAFATENDSHVSTRPAGTLGYVDPEFQSSGNFNKKSDVYSFGIILFELITGRAAIVRGPVRNNHILDWVNPLIERGDVQNIIDPRLEGEFNSTSAWKAIEIAMSCIPSYAIQRPDMSYVLAELKECLALEMAHERTQRMATEGNLTTSNIPFKMAHLKYESDIVPHSR